MIYWALDSRHYRITQAACDFRMLILSQMSFRLVALSMSEAQAGKQV